MYASRMQRLQDDLIEKQMQECTFKPKIRELPDEYVSNRRQNNQLSFQERIDQWKLRKAEETERKRREKEQEELKGCTFRPNIQKKAPRATTPRVVASPRTGQSELSSGRSLPSSGELAEGFRDGGNGLRTHERLYRESKVDKLKELQERARKEEEEQLRKDCTFKPNINKSVRLPVRSRYKQAAALASASSQEQRQQQQQHHQQQQQRPGSAPRGERRASASGSRTPRLTARQKHAWDENCTFTPQTNPIHPNMEAAQVYLSNDIFSRLTQPREALYSEDGGEMAEAAAGAENASHGANQSERVMDLDTFMSTLGSDAQGRATAGTPKSRSKKRPTSAPRQRPSSASGSRRQLSQEELAERRQSFEAFLARQQQTEMRKQQKIKQVAAQITPAHKPQLCKKSVEMATQNTKGTFLQRVAKGALRKEHAHVRLKSQVVDPECTFKPKINENAKRRAARSAVEMSRGDSLRKETKARLMKLRVEQEELEELTFQPDLNNRKGAESRLKILSEPDTYIRRLQHKTTLQSHKQSKAAQEQEMKELEECTFKPEIHEAPTYVKRIVRSLALAKPAREAQAAAQKPERPEWK